MPGKSAVDLGLPHRPRRRRCWVVEFVENAGARNVNEDAVGEADAEVLQVGGARGDDGVVSARTGLKERHALEAREVVARRRLRGLAVVPVAQKRRRVERQQHRHHTPGEAREAAREDAVKGAERVRVRRHRWRRRRPRAPSGRRRWHSGRRRPRSSRPSGAKFAAPSSLAPLPASCRRRARGPQGRVLSIAVLHTHTTQTHPCANNQPSGHWLRVAPFAHSQVRSRRARR